MPFFIENFSWMALNSVLALVPVVLVVVLRHKVPRLANIILFFLWLLFLPNTIYLITDLQHLPAQLLKSKDMTGQAILIIQYVVLAALGVVTYIYALEPVRKYLKSSKKDAFVQNGIYVLLNYIIAFGVILGKVQRTHSWYVFTDPARVTEDIMATITQMHLIVWIIVMGTVTNVLFFLFRNYFPLPHFKKKRKV